MDMKEMLDWYVVTGSPSSGVTTTISYLEKLGYYVVEEMARKVIDREIEKGRTTDEIRKNERQFQTRVLRLNLENLKLVPRDRTVFFDRGIPDSLAYYEINGMELGEVLQHCREKIYRKVFFLERLPYKKDYARIEDEDTARKIGELSKKWYTHLGYVVLLIPRLPVKEKVDVIVCHINRY